MRYHRIVAVLSIINLLVLGFVVSETRSSAGPAVTPIVRARVIELVDENGKTRAQLNVEPTGETVFRLRDKHGTIRAKFGASEDGSGLSMMDDRTEATVQVRANKTGGGITLFDRAGQKRDLD